MYLQRILFCCLYLDCLFTISYGLFLPSHEPGLNAVKKAPRFADLKVQKMFVLCLILLQSYRIAVQSDYERNMPWLGVGLWCNGCPPLSCEDDEAIIHGYCCGCAYGLDKLPVLCPEFLQCPLNLHGLCHDYEYMMRCCC